MKVEEIVQIGKRANLFSGIRSGFNRVLPRCHPSICRKCGVDCELHSEEREGDEYLKCPRVNRSNRVGAVMGRMLFLEGFVGDRFHFGSVRRRDLGSRKSIKEEESEEVESVA